MMTVDMWLLGLSTKHSWTQPIYGLAEDLKNIDFRSGKALDLKEH